MLKRLVLGLVVAASSLLAVGQADADVYVQGYYRSNGTYVQPHYRSNPDGYFYNNWSTYPNINPYTGRMGTRLTPSYYPSYRSYYSVPSYRSYYSRGSWSW